MLATLPASAFLIGSASLATWQGYRITPLPVGNQLVLHQSLTSMPPEISSMSQTLPKQLGKDPFFRMADRG